jgi:NADPH:quinone reductase-like Zn-dependent oxidoreductase
VAFRGAGAWAEFARAPVSRVYPVPIGISDEVASQFALNPLTAWGLLAECNLPASSRILITAGRSAVARLLTELAERRSLETTLLVRAGAGYAALDGRSGEVIARGTGVGGTLQAFGKDRRFEAILDSVGGTDSLALMDVLSPMGRLVSYGILDDTDIVLRASRIVYKNMIWQGFGIDAWLDHATDDQLEAAQRELWAMLARNPDLLPVAARFDLAQIHDALRTASNLHRPGKVLLLG